MQSHRMNNFKRGSHVASASTSRTNMTACAFLLAGFLMVALLLVLPVRAQVNGDLPDSPFIAVSEAVRPAVVNIRIVRSTTSEGMGTGSLQEMYRRFFPDEEGQGGRFESPSTGSGFVVDADRKSVV